MFLQMIKQLVGLFKAAIWRANFLFHFLSRDKLIIQSCVRQSCTGLQAVPEQEPRSRDVYHKQVYKV